MEGKIEDYFKKHKLGKTQYIKENGKWSNGKIYHVKVKKILPPNEFTIYELNNEIKTVRSLQTDKTY